MSLLFNLPGDASGSSTASFSPCRRYRYTLTRVWSNAPLVAFIGLNPSTADETKNDPTVRRCIGFAKAWGGGGLLMLNAFAFRATDPRVMKAEAEPVGSENDEAIENAAMDVRIKTIVAAWGRHGAHRDRGVQVAQLVRRHRDLMCLGVNADGSPVHPLYIPADRELRSYVPGVEPRYRAVIFAGETIAHIFDEAPLPGPMAMGETLCGQDVDPPGWWTLDPERPGKPPTIGGTHDAYCQTCAAKIGTREVTP